MTRSWARTNSVALRHRVDAEPDDRLVVDVALGGEPVEHPAHPALGVAGVEPGRGLRDLRPRPVRGRPRRVPAPHRRRWRCRGSVPACGRTGLRRVAGRRSASRAGPAATSMCSSSAVDGGVAGRLDLGPQRRLLAQCAFELGREQGASAGELPDRGLDVHPRHRPERARVPDSSRCRHRGQPAGGRPQPVAERREVARQQRCRSPCRGWRRAGPTRCRAVTRGPAVGSAARSARSRRRPGRPRRGRRRRPTPGLPVGDRPRPAPPPGRSRPGRRAGRRSGGRRGSWPTRGAARAARPGPPRSAGGRRWRCGSALSRRRP